MKNTIDRAGVIAEMWNYCENKCDEDWCGPCRIKELVAVVENYKSASEDLGCKYDDESPEDRITITLPKEAARALMYYMEWSLFDEIRNDENIDNIRWVRVRLDLYDNIAKALGEPDSGGSALGYGGETK